MCPAPEKRLTRTGSRTPNQTSMWVRDRAIIFRLAVLLVQCILPIPASFAQASHPDKPPGAAAQQADKPWKVLEPGLELGAFALPLKSEYGDSRIQLLRIDPHVFDLRLLNAAAPDQGKPLTAKEWCHRNGLVAAINASMFQADNRTSVALMKTIGHINNPTLSKDKSILVFDPLDSHLPAVQVIDRDCQELSSLRKHYGTLIQGIRMISCKGRNVWGQQPRRWSTAAIAMDSSGKILFIHVRSPYSTHDLINMLAALPIGIRNTMYVEGGPEAQLYVQSSDEEIELVGSYETGFNENDDNAEAWPIPNVVAVARKTAQSE